jgi:DNA-directed RNA polymerase subunit RPC12/RpoP
MSLIDKAKALIAKGKQLQDEGLIQMGMDLLNEIETEFKYQCANCLEIHTLDKPRKRCPNCKKQQLVEMLAEPEPEPQSDEKGITTVFANGNKPANRQFTDEAGEVHTLMRSEPIQVNSQPVDSGEYKKDTAEQAKMTPNWRRGHVRPPIAKKYRNCSSCGNNFELKGNLQQRKCDRCIMGLVRGR